MKSSFSPKKFFKRQKQASEPLRKLLLFFTPLRIVQLTGFLLILFGFLRFYKISFFQDGDICSYGVFLKYQTAFANVAAKSGEATIRAISAEMNQWILFCVAFLSGIFFMPFRKIFSVVSAVILASLWVFCSYIVFSKHGIWTGVAAHLALMLCFFLWSLWIEIIEYERKLSFYNLAVRDPLTGLYLVGYISAVLSRFWHYSELIGKPFAVILFEIDGFRKINETYGYQAGDEVLKKVTEIISDSIRTKGRAMPDVLGRYGPAEFIVLLAGYDVADVVSPVADRIRKTIKEFVFQMENKIFFISACAGISVLQPDEKAPEKVVERAQGALFQAKQMGKNQVFVKNN